MSARRHRRKHRSTSRGRCLLVVCARIGSGAPVPAGYGTADCRECGRAVWISPTSLGFGRRVGLEVVALCHQCIRSGCKPDRNR